MESYIARNAVISIFLVIIGISYMSANRLADGVEGERSIKYIKAKPALCQPESQVVSVKENMSHLTSYFPSCVRINRCGGCCNHELMSCQPTRTEIRNYEIQAFTLGLTGTIVNREKEIVSLEEHTECECGCILKAKDCTDKQVYQKEECRCRCSNSDEKNKCQQQSELKFWDPASCSCHCRKIRECTMGFVFDTESCSCVRQHLLI